jgi:hypothetical protein
MSTNFSKPVFVANSFLVAQEPALPAEAATLTEASYVLVPQGLRVADEEVETMASAVEVQVLWGANVLSITHLDAGKSFAVGSVDGVDFVLPEEKLGRDRLALVSMTSGSPSLVIPEDATVSVGAQRAVPAAELLAKGAAKVSSEGRSVLEMPVAEGQSIRVNLAGSEIAYIVRGVRAGKAPVAAGFLAGLSGAASKYMGLSLLGHLGVIASLAYFMPSMGADDTEAMNRENVLFMQKMLNAKAPPELKEQQDQGAGETTPAESGGKGERAAGAEGTMGKDTAKADNARWGFKGNSQNPQVQQKSDLELASQFGMVDLLLSSKSGPSAFDPNAPSAKWGAFEAQGADAKSAQGNMWGVTIGDSFGGGAFGLTGNGEGGGGLGQGIGLDRVGGLGHGAGGGDGQGFGPGKDGIGTGHGPLSRGHVAKGPGPLREGHPEVNGHLPAEVIQRVVRANFGRFRNCYDTGLRSNPSLAGRVVTKFIIGRDGSVTVSADGGSDMADRSVVNCVVRSYQNLSFPAPQNGQVTVTYPISFSPAE